MGISVTDPISQAINRAKFITFQPFDVAKWFTLGFIAWISTLGEGGGGNLNTGSRGGRAPAPIRIPTPGVPGVPGTPSTPAFPQPAPPPNPFAEMWDWITSHVALSILIGLIAFAVIIGIALVVMWISSRGKFMFLRAVATNTTQIKATWTEFRDLGNSLFAFRVCLTAIAFAVNVAIIGVALLIAWVDIRAGTFGAAGLTAILLGVLVLLPCMIAFALVNWATNTFVTIVMYARGIPALEAWREFRFAILPGNVGALVLFLLMSIVLAIATVIIQMIAGCVTCCVGFLPYLSTVITLPIAVFWRCYSIYFLQQFGVEYAIIQEAPQSMGFPVTPYPPQWPPPNS